MKRESAPATILKPMISVIIPCFNGENFLKEAINSALDQTYPYVEVVVVDDGSTDRSPEIMDSYGSRIKIVRQSNRGLPAARNSGIRASQGEFLAFLDADDYWRSDFLEKMAVALEQEPRAAVAYCGWQNIGLPGGRGNPYVPRNYETSHKIEDFLRHSSLWPVHAALVRRSALDEIGGFDESLPTCEDYDFWLRLVITRPIVRVGEVLAFYRHHGQAQMTSKQWLQAKYNWKIKKDFISQYPHLVVDIPRKKLFRLFNQELLKRGYACFWRRDLISAQKIFRMSLLKGSWNMKDLKYLFPALLPLPWYRSLITAIDKRNES